VVQRLTEKFVKNKLFHQVVQNKSNRSALMAKGVETWPDWVAADFFVGSACVAVFRQERVLQYGYPWDLIIPDGALF
jgi:hypothetical protein